MPCTCFISCVVAAVPNSWLIASVIAKSNLLIITFQLSPQCSLISSEHSVVAFQKSIALKKKRAYFHIMSTSEDYFMFSMAIIKNNEVSLLLI